MENYENKLPGRDNQMSALPSQEPLDEAIEEARRYKETLEKIEELKHGKGGLDNGKECDEQLHDKHGEEQC